MIIRRRHTKSFVTLENLLVRDRRLALDEHGMLHYLLSLPDDWEVSRANCAKFWDIGRDKAARIFRSLRKFGWAQVERVHAEDGTFLGVRWIITDEPGEEVPEALLDQEGDEKEMPSISARAPPDHDTENPDDGSTVARVNHTPEKAYHGPYIDSTKTDSKENRFPQNGACEKTVEVQELSFGDLANQWPPDHILSRIAAEQAWHQRTRMARQQAIDYAPAYLAECRAKSRKVCDLTTYLREARFERFVGKAKRASQTFTARPYSPQWFRWKEYRLATNQPIAFMEQRARNGDGWTTSSEWPPPLPDGVKKLDAPPSAAADPPETHLSEQDMADFH